jgi:hypothetical protein
MIAGFAQLAHLPEVGKSSDMMDGASRSSTCVVDGSISCSPGGSWLPVHSVKHGGVCVRKITQLATWTAATVERLKWVRLGPRGALKLGPFIPQQRTSWCYFGMSVECHKLTFQLARNQQHPLHASSSSKALACFKSNVSKPSVNQASTEVCCPFDLGPGRPA